jgi:mannose-6-phosphate isomerase-like protein (cupin superfamily)
MRRLESQLMIAVILSCAAGLLPAVAQKFVPPAAPAPGSPATFVTQQELTDKLHALVASGGDPASSPVGVTDQYSINVVHRGKTGAPAVHTGWTELHYILEGGGIFVTGGKIIKPPGAAQGIVEGGVSRSVKAGDAVIVPPDTVHWYKEVDGTLTYLEVRFVAPPAAAAK